MKKKFNKELWLRSKVAAINAIKDVDLTDSKRCYDFKIAYHKIYKKDGLVPFLNRLLDNLPKTAFNTGNSLTINQNGDVDVFLPDTILRELTRVFTRPFIHIMDEIKLRKDIICRLADKEGDMNTVKETLYQYYDDGIISFPRVSELTDFVPKGDTLSTSEFIEESIDKDIDNFMRDVKDDVLWTNVFETASWYYMYLHRYLKLVYPEVTSDRDFIIPIGIDTAVVVTESNIGIYRR